MNVNSALPGRWENWALSVLGQLEKLEDWQEEVRKEISQLQGEGVISQSDLKQIKKEIMDLSKSLSDSETTLENLGRDISLIKLKIALTGVIMGLIGGGLIQTVINHFFK